MSTTEMFAAHRPFTMSNTARVKMRIVSVVSWFWIRNRNRQAMQYLMEMEDWQLSDIGLTRSDLGFAHHHRFFDDPSQNLLNLARNKGIST